MMNYWKICAKLSTSIPGMYFIGKFMKPKDRNDNENHHNENHYKLQFLVESNSEGNEVLAHCMEKNNHPYNENHYKLQFLVESNSGENEVLGHCVERGTHTLDEHSHTSAGVEVSGESHVEL